MTSTTLSEKGDARSEATPKRVRARTGGVFVADTRRARIFWAGPVSRSYAVPRDEIDADVGAPQAPEDVHLYGTVRAVDLTRKGAPAGRAFLPPERLPELEDHLILDWDSFDAVYEEDEEVFVHPHDPYHRIDILQSTRHVVVERDGVRLAESRRPVMLLETSLPVRHYLPQTDVRLDLLEESDTTTGCAYKGFAKYRHVRVGDARVEDLVWTYPTPLAEAQKIQGLLCFFDERVDVTVDGERQARPQTPWSEE